MPDRFVEKAIKCQKCGTMFVVELEEPEVPKVLEPEPVKAPETLRVQRETGSGPDTASERETASGGEPLRDMVNQGSSAPARETFVPPPPRLRKKPPAQKSSSLVPALLGAFLGLGLLCFLMCAGSLVWLFTSIRGASPTGMANRVPPTERRAPRTPPGTVKEKEVTVIDLVKQLDTSDAKACAATIQTLGGRGADAVYAVPALLTIAKKKDPVLSPMALEALRKIGPPHKSELPALVASLKHDGADVRRYTLNAIGALGADGRSAAPAVCAELKDPDATVRQAAADALGGCGPEGRTLAWPALIEVVEDTDGGVRAAAIASLDKLGTPAKLEVPLLLSLIESKHNEVVLYSTRTLGRLGPEAVVATAALAKALGHADAGVRRAAGAALLAVGQGAKPATPALLAALKDEDADVRRYALLTLAQVGVDSSTLLPVLAAVEEAEESDVTTVTNQMRSKIVLRAGDAPLLCRALASKHADVRAVAADSLHKLNPDPKTALAPLIKALMDMDPRVRAASAATIGLMGADARPASAELIKALNDDDEKVRTFVIASVHALAMQSKDMVGELAAALAEEGTRDGASAVLVKLGKPAVFPVVRLLGQRKEAIRLAAVKVLAEMGPAAAEAVPALQLRKTNDVSPTVREEAKTALLKIQGK